MFRNNSSEQKPYFFINSPHFKPSNSKVHSYNNLSTSLGASRPFTNVNQLSSVKKNTYQQKKDCNSPYWKKFPVNPEHSNVRLQPIIQQNFKLKKENQLLREQLQKMKNQQLRAREYSSLITRQRTLGNQRENSSNQRGVDLRCTIKKQSPVHQLGQNQQLQNKVKILMKQCKLYEQNIQKMESTIRRLTDQNKFLKSSKIETKIENNNLDISKPEQTIKNARKTELEVLKQKINLIMKDYSQLESKINSRDLEWTIWKEQWITEKNIYLTKIKYLEAKIKIQNKESVDNSQKTIFKSNSTNKL